MSLWEAVVCQITSQGHCGEEGPEEELVTFLLWSKESPLLAFVTPGVQRAVKYMQCPIWKGKAT